jgi:hypothetical protein
LDHQQLAIRLFHHQLKQDLLLRRALRFLLRLVDCRQDLRQARQVMADRKALCPQVSIRCRLASHNRMLRLRDSLLLLASVVPKLAQCLQLLLLDRQAVFRDMVFVNECSV